MFNAKYSPSYNNAPQLYVVDSNSTDALDSHSTDALRVSLISTVEIFPIHNNNQPWVEVHKKLREILVGLS